MASFILEIGSEEMPAKFLPVAEAALAKFLADGLDSAGIDHGAITVFSTPRRLGARVENVAPFQKEGEELLQGPPASVAYDKEGRPTRALIGFCQTNNASLEDMAIVENQRGKYVAIKRKTGGKPAEEAIAEILPKIITSLPFPKKMRWGSHALHYIRPLKWILAMLGDKVCQFSVGHVQSGNLTYGHRIHGPGPFVINSANDYEEVVASCGKVDIYGDARMRKIREEGNKLANGEGCSIVWKEPLLREVSGLVECPVPILARFPEEYLEVPAEVLLTSMESHQKSFGLCDETGKLSPLFLTVLNLVPENIEPARSGWEKVLRARLEDARFFWREDLATGFETWQKKLEKVIFIGPLGSVAEKERRVARLCQWLAVKTALVPPETAYRAGELSKADLVSGVVGEFTDLQGIMGGIYAEKAGESPEVAQAIREQYLPLGPESPIPASKCGALLAIADKADTLAGCFGLKRIPSGNADPDGLRRAALGIIRIMLAYDFQLSTREIFAEALKLYGDRKWKMPEPEILDKLEEFMLGRLRNWFVSTGFNNSHVDAALATPFRYPAQAEKKIRALRDFLESDAASDLPGLFKRIENITRNQEELPESWRKELLESEAEKELAAVLETGLPEMDRMLAEERYGDVLSSMAALQMPINKFFDGVLVLCDDPELRRNRLGLLGALLSRSGHLANFSRLRSA